ncbi:HAD family hydrolase [Chloroflexota bacterium]
MIKAVFFDWFNTLACFDPPRNEMHSQALKEHGIEVSPQKILRGVFDADSYWFEENAKFPMRNRSPEEQDEVNLHYQEIVLEKVGLCFSRDLLWKIHRRVRELFKGLTFALFEDVLAVLPALKERGLTLGLLTNLARDMEPICSALGLEPYLDFIVTSKDIGVDKPNPPIFLAALELAKVDASEVIHVGDQYKFDVVGARGVGISPILIDRYDLYSGANDCPRIRSLNELTQYLQ